MPGDHGNGAGTSGPAGLGGTCGLGGRIGVRLRC
jgi:hypothetical protein